MAFKRHIQFYVVAVSVVTILSVQGYPNIPKLPCEKCDINKIHPWGIKMMSPICGPCGDIYGLGYEYCCMCHEHFRLACEVATESTR